MKGIPSSRPPLSSPELRRRKIRDFSPGSSSESPTLSRRVLRDFSPSSDDSSLSRTQGRSRGLSLYKRQQQKLVQMGIPGTWMMCMSWWSDCPCCAGWLVLWNLCWSHQTLSWMCVPVVTKQLFTVFVPIILIVLGWRMYSSWTLIQFAW